MRAVRFDARSDRFTVTGEGLEAADLAGRALRAATGLRLRRVLERLLGGSRSRH